MSSSYHSVDWDFDTDRPIVDGKTINPITGAIQPRGEHITYGPPTLDVMWHNMLASPEGFITIRKPHYGTIEDMFIRAAQHVGKGFYKLIGVNATAYSFFITCQTELTDKEFGEKVFGHDYDPDQFTYTDNRGETRKVYFPLGREDEIYNFMRTRNWAELAKLPTTRPEAPP